MLRSLEGREVFREFLRSEYSEDNLLFWLACEDLKKETSTTLVDEKARIIYEDYVSILSPKEVQSVIMSMWPLPPLARRSALFYGAVILMRNGSWEFAFVRQNTQQCILGFVVLAVYVLCNGAKFCPRTRV